MGPLLQEAGPGHTYTLPNNFTDSADGLHEGLDAQFLSFIADS